MPPNLTQAINFLETQWSANVKTPENKIKGILAEVRFKSFLLENKIDYVSGGWLVIPGNCSQTPLAPREKICILPLKHSFTWQEPNIENQIFSVAEINAHSHFSQVGIKTYFAKPTSINEQQFEIPKQRAGKIKAKYPISYKLDLLSLSNLSSPTLEDPSKIFSLFPKRSNNIGLRCQKTGRIDTSQAPWTIPKVVSDLFWFEYARYYFQRDYLLSNNDLDMFIMGKNRTAYPVELKSKKPAFDKSLGVWFGIDVGPFAKLAFFTANSLKSEALFVVEEISDSGQTANWLGLKFTDLVKSCSWVGIGGGKGMMGGMSTTLKIPKAAFTPLKNLIHEL